MIATLDPKMVTVRMRAQGYTFDQISSALDIPLATVYGWLRNAEGMGRQTGVRPGSRVRKLKLGHGEIKDLVAQGLTFKEVGERAGVTKERIRQIAGTGATKAVRVVRMAEKRECLRQTAGYFRREYRKALRSAGWRRCSGPCHEWMPVADYFAPYIAKQKKGSARCRFCPNEYQRRMHAGRNGLTFIPNDPEIWWPVILSGGRMERVVRRRKRGRTGDV